MKKKKYLICLVVLASNILLTASAHAAFDEISYDEMVSDLARMKGKNSSTSSGLSVQNAEARLGLNTNLFQYRAPTGEKGKGLLTGPSLQVAFKTDNSPFLFEVGGRYLTPTRVEGYLHTLQDLNFGFGGETRLNKDWRARFVTGLGLRRYSWETTAFTKEYWKVHPALGINFVHNWSQPFFFSLASQVDLGIFGNDEEVNQLSVVAAIGATL